jgi:5-formyltetrahydrofolate cyclo-ligase
MTGDHAEAKHAARREGRAARRSVLAEERPSLAAAAAERLLALPELASARTVLAYSATAEEIDPAPVVSVLRERGMVIALPRLLGPERHLSLHRVDADDALVEGPFGLLEPSAGAPIVAPGSIDVTIVPGVAFDSACQRIGHGGGYYDRLFGIMPGAVTVGIAFDGQVLAEVPREEHDVCLDVLVTPTRTLRRRSP